MNDTPNFEDAEREIQHLESHPSPDREGWTRRYRSRADGLHDVEDVSPEGQVLRVALVDARPSSPVSPVRTRAIVEAAEALEQALHERAEQHVVGRNAELADVEYLIEHGGGLEGAIARECVRQLVHALAIPSPQWTRTPPSEPGYYWVRRTDGEGDQMEFLVLAMPQVNETRSLELGDGTMDLSDVLGPEWVWFPVRIEEPPA